ncbi:hypothetical protein F511_33623 [Dorcoceras hygrometricum]|uniref:Uncharacterized protein n=1 Tax=Dorcoceras hygrometricum TaxID=472368 RepID=A0A2Z7BA46_9LAMI|nr:hypothetical protein F511_33623 [Dorcoceras hygrometricum]
MSTGYAIALKLATGSTIARRLDKSCDWYIILRLDALAAGCPVVGSEKLATGISNDCAPAESIALYPSAGYDDVTDDVIISKPSAVSLARRRFLHCYVCCWKLLVQHCSSAVNGFLNSDCQQIRQQYL